MGLSKQLLFLNFDLNNGNTPNFKEDIGEYYFQPYGLNPYTLKLSLLLECFWCTDFFVKRNYK